MAVSQTGPTQFLLPFLVVEISFQNSLKQIFVRFHPESVRPLLPFQLWEESECEGGLLAHSTVFAVGAANPSIELCVAFLCLLWPITSMSGDCLNLLRIHGGQVIVNAFMMDRLMQFPERRLSGNCSEVFNWSSPLRVICKDNWQVCSWIWIAVLFWYVYFTGEREDLSGPRLREEGAKMRSPGCD